MSPAVASSTATPTTSPPASPPTAATAIPSSPAATGWSSRGPARGPTARSSCAGCSAWKTCSPWAFAARPTTSAAGPSTSTPAASTRCSRIQRLQDAYFARVPDYPKGITVPAIVDVPTGQVVTNDFAQITLDFSTEWTDVPPRRRARAVPRAAARRDRRGRQADLHRGQQRRLPVRLRRLAGGLRQGLRPAVHRAGLARRAAGEPALSGRRHHHRGRRPAVHHAGPLRPRLPRPLQVQPAASSPRCRCCGPTRATCSRRPGFGDTIDFVQIKQHYYIVHTDINPTQIVPKGPDLSELADPARPGSVGRQAVRRRHAAGPDAGGRAGARRARRRLGPDGAHRPLGVRHAGTRCPPRRGPASAVAPRSRTACRGAGRRWGW